jgi:uncharacterized repeat protein (TIGR01451 family)
VRDDSFATASTISPAAGQPGHTFDRWSDKDWAKFQAEPGAQYVITTANLTPPYDPDGFFADTVLELYAPDGVTRLDESDDYGGTYASRIDWQAQETSTYYLKVYNYNPGVFGCAVGYDLILEETLEAVPLDITKSAVDLNNAPLYVGDVIRYTITVTNPDPSQAHTNVVITDTIPTATTFVPGSVVLETPPGSWSVGSTTPILRVTGASLGPGGTVQVTFDVEVNPGTIGQTILNQAHVISDQMDQRSTPPIGPPGSIQVVPGPFFGIYIPIIFRKP